MKWEDMHPFENILYIGEAEDYGHVFVRISYDGSRLSITGVVNPKGNGNANRCGQIDLSEYSWVFSYVDTERLFDTWRRWHLNDLRAGTPAQEECLRKHRVRNPANQFDRAGRRP